MVKRHVAWSGALTVVVITTVLVVLDLADGAVHRFWSRHSFSSSVLSGVLVLLLTVLIVDRVNAHRRLRDQSRALAAQAAIIVAQAKRAADAIASPSPSDDALDAASDELRTYTQMLMTSAPVLISGAVPRAFLESAQRLAVQLYRAYQAARDGRADQTTGLDQAVEQLRASATPLLAALSRDERAAVTTELPDDGG